MAAGDVRTDDERLAVLLVSVAVAAPGDRIPAIEVIGSLSGAEVHRAVLSLSWLFWRLVNDDALGAHWDTGPATSFAFGDIEAAMSLARLARHTGSPSLHAALGGLDPGEPGPAVRTLVRAICAVATSASGSADADGVRQWLSGWALRLCVEQDAANA